MCSASTPRAEHLLDLVDALTLRVRRQMTVQIREHNNGRRLAGLLVDFDKAMAADFGQWQERRGG